MPGEKTRLSAVIVPVRVRASQHAGVRGRVAAVVGCWEHLRGRQGDVEHDNRSGTSSTYVCVCGVFVCR
jgi:hypothetical protein